MGLIATYGDPAKNFEINQQAGSSFEEDFIGIMKKVFIDENIKIKDVTGTNQDRYEGTDMIYGEIRIDPTTNFEHKNYMPFMAQTDIPAIPGYNFKMGIRIGNKHNGQYTNFPKPVVVVGVDMEPNVFRLYQEQICENVEKYAREIVIAAEDCLTDYMTKDADEREMLDFRPLEKNPYFKQNKDTNSKYRQLNSVDHKKPAPTPADYA